MSSETDHPRQRTVAELLAEHGDAGATGRRRRRRTAESSPAGAAQPVNGTAPAAPDWRRARAGPDRSVPREPGPRADEPEPRVGRLAPPVTRGPERPPMGRGPEPGPDRPTDQMPRIRDGGPAGLDPHLTAPIEHQRAGRDGADPAAVARGRSDDGPSTMVRAAPAGADAHWAPTADRIGAPADGGPPTQAAVPADLDDVGDHRMRRAGIDQLDRDDRPANAEPRRRLGRTAAAKSSGRARVAVLAQWIIGALGGAALWVGFRFLWRGLPVVALAAAVLVTVGLVVVVRALLRNDDTRTTVFAVFVGLLLTVSPAILVLLDR